MNVIFIGWVHLKLVEKANEGLELDEKKETKSRVGAAIERLEERSLSK